MHTQKWQMIVVKLTVLGGLMLSACQAQTQTPAIQITEAWGRPSPSSTATGVFYLKITNTSSQADKLVSAQSSACGVVEIHETIQNGDTMGMRPVDGGIVEIPAGETVAFETGGLHLMCIDKQNDFSPGAAIPLTLQFENYGTVELQAEIRSP